MIDLYTMRTGNGYRASIMLEEVGLPYRVIEADVRPGQPRSETFLTASPLGKIPAIVDHDTPDGVPIAIAESLAIALYLADKTGKLIPEASAERAAAYQWSAVVAAGFGAAITGIFFARQIDAAAHAGLIAKYHADIDQGFAAMDRRLSDNAYLAGATYSVADVLAAPLLNTAKLMGCDTSYYTGVQRWYADVSARSAVQRGMAVPSAQS
jgi:GST-like protein